VGPGGTHVDAALVGAHRLDVVLLYPPGQRERAGQQDVERLGRVAFGEDRAARLVPLDRAVPGQPGELLLGERLEQEQVLQVRRAELLSHCASRYRCTSVTAIAPSPTAEATRLTELDRTSPAAK